MTPKHRRGCASFWASGGGGYDQSQVSTLSEERVELQGPRSSINLCNCLEDELWCDYEHSRTIFTAVSQTHGLKAQLGNECLSAPYYFSYCSTRCPLLLIYSVGLNHPADAQSNVTELKLR